MLIIFSARGTRAIALICAGALLGCGADTTAPPATNVVPRLQLNHHAVTLALHANGYDTVQLTATARTTLGVPIPDVGTVHYTVAAGDTSVSVSPTGLLTAHSPTTGVTVSATAMVNGVTVRDSVSVAVNDLAGVSVPSPAQLVLRPAVGSTVANHCGTQNGSLRPSAFYTPTVLTVSNDTISNVAVKFVSSDSTRIRITPQPLLDDSGLPIGVTGGVALTCQSLGPVWIYATATVYGVTLTDSLRLTAGAPTQVIVQIVAQKSTSGILEPSFSVRFVSVPDATLTLEAGGSVLWVNTAKLPVDVIFDKPADVSATVDPLPDMLFNIYTIFPTGETGDIGLFDTDTTDGTIYHPTNFRARRFLTPGTYHYSTTQSAGKGTLIVVPQP